MQATATPFLPNIEKLNEDIKHFPHIAPVTDEMHLVLKGVSRLVMLDRYSYKDVQLLTLGLGDLVIATYKEDPKFPRRGYGEVIDVNGDYVTVKMDEQFEGGIEITVNKNKISKPLEVFYEQIADRVARGLAKPEKPENFEPVRKVFYDLLVSFSFVPAGRVLMGAGSGQGVTFFNCYVMPFIADSRGGIGEHRKPVMEIMSRGGGVGTNGSTLRPRDTICHGVNGKSSGSVTWLNDLANLTNLVEQGGSRRGAQMIMLNVWHPDVIEFIISKIQKPSVLQYLIKTSKDPLIRSEAERKLKFEPFKKHELDELNFIVNTLENTKHAEEFVGGELTDEEQVLLDNTKERLKAGGVYSVHEPEFLTGANISVCFTKEFMKAVEDGTEFALQFPDLDSYGEEERAIYDAEWHECGDVREWASRGHAIKTYHTIKAKELWNLVNVCATYSAEPGIFFLDNANDMTNAIAYGQKVVATNPCGEQPLAPWSVCNLAAVNLAVMEKDGEVDYKKLKRTVFDGIRMQDNVIDATPYFLEQNTKQALGERRIGLGVMGLHDLLIRLQLRYGSEEGNVVVDKVFETIATTAYRASIELAKEKGSFPFLTVLPDGTENIHGVQKFVNSGYMKRMPDDIRTDIMKYGIRNSHLLTVAPTGSTGTMMNVSTGLEPYFSFIYYRSGRLGKFIPVIADIAVEWLENHGYEITEDNVFEMIEHLPDYFVGTMDLSPEAHADVQCIIQRWVDSSISKTVNAPRGYKVPQVAAVYERLWKGGAKGGTVYVDGSRDSQVLTIDAEENDMTETIDEVAFVETEVPENVYIKQELEDPEKHFGSDVGDTCIICRVGTMKDHGGCSTCDNCGAQLKCGL